jgi:N-acetylglucosaminyl-diphospho-decaprenol L-rhamnosyltransferase
MTTTGPAGSPPDRLRDLELVVVAYRSREQIEQLLAGLPKDWPLVVIDNSDGSDGLCEVTEARPASRYLEGGGVGFARAANRGARTSKATNLVFINPDTRPTPEAIAALVEDVASDPTLSASAGTLVEPDGRPQIGVGGWEPSLLRAVVHSVGLHKLLPRRGLYARPAIGEDIDVDWVTGAVVATRRDVFLELGGFDEDFYVYMEDVSYGRASRAAGLHERLRTDIPIPGGSGGSGAPSLEMMRLRGASMSRYLLRHHSSVRAWAIIAVFGAGYAVRAAEQVLLCNPRRAREHWEHAAGAWTGRATVGGRVVTER